MSASFYNYTFIILQNFKFCKLKLRGISGFMAQANVEAKNLDFKNIIKRFPHNAER